MVLSGLAGRGGDPSTELFPQPFLRLPIMEGFYRKRSNIYFVFDCFLLFFSSIVLKLFLKFFVADLLLLGAFGGKSTGRPYMA